ncbi:MAG: response regulator transcription factor [Bacteroidales bacterium]|jgi:two-component system nitrate/nitrite response regulator NarL|nr:response regulator transcription factor [Bacteroidales bacterium]
MKKIKILLADDHSIIIDGIKAMLINNSEIEIIGQAKDGIEAIELANNLKPDVIIMDISMPNKSGIEATKQIKENNKSVKIIILTQHENKEYVIQLLKVGADGYLLKNSKKAELFEAIQTVTKGEKYIGKHASTTLISLVENNVTEQNEQAILTKREIEIIKMIVEDLSNQKIANNLNISIRTVETHRRNIMQKLNVKSAVALVKYALRNNIINLS